MPSDSPSTKSRRFHTDHGTHSRPSGTDMHLLLDDLLYGLGFDHPRRGGNGVVVMVVPFPAEGSLYAS